MRAWLLLFFSVLASAAALFDVGNYIGIIILSLFTSSSLLLLCLDVVITIVVAVFMCHCQCICIIAVAFIFMTIFILFDLRKSLSPKMVSGILFRMTLEAWHEMGRDFELMTV